MAEYLVETFYTCTFKIVHKLDELNEKKLSDLEKRKDGKVEIIDVVLNNRKTKTTAKAENSNAPANSIQNTSMPDVSKIITKKFINTENPGNGKESDRTTLKSDGLGRINNRSICFL